MPSLAFSLEGCCASPLKVLVVLGKCFLWRWKLKLLAVSVELIHPFPIGHPARQGSSGLWWPSFAGSTASS